MTEQVCPTDHVPTVKEAKEKERERGGLSGETFAGRYRIERLIGTGGYGKVYLSTQLGMDRMVALKTLHSSYVSERRHLRRFYQEARAASRLSSPHVVRIYEFGVDEISDTPFIAMEMLSGQSLKQLVTEEAPLSPARAATICAQVARALLDAQGAGIVHRDLKPSNVFLLHSRAGGDFAKVMDFGLAKLLRDDSSSSDAITATGMTIGTPRYMAPEQILGEDVDTRTDLYALGCILHELLTGEPPFVVEDKVATLMKHLNEEAAALSDPLPCGAPLASELDQLHRAMLAKEMDERPADAQVVVEVLEAVAQDRSLQVAALMAAAKKARSGTMVLKATETTAGIMDLSDVAKPVPASQESESVKAPPKQPPPAPPSKGPEPEHDDDDDDDEATIVCDPSEALASLEDEAATLGAETPVEAAAPAADQSLDEDEEYDEYGATVVTEAWDPSQHSVAPPKAGASSPEPAGDDSSDSDELATMEIEQALAASKAEAGDAATPMKTRAKPATGPLVSPADIVSPSPPPPAQSTGVDASRPKTNPFAPTIAAMESVDEPSIFHSGLHSLL